MTAVQINAVIAAKVRLSRRIAANRKRFKGR